MMPKRPGVKNKQGKDTSRKRFVTIRLNRDALKQDDVDYLYCLQHKDDPSISLDEFLNKIGHEVDRPRKKAS